MPHTNSHKTLDTTVTTVPTEVVVHVPHADPLTTVALAAGAVAGVVAARSRRVRPLSAAGRARVDAGESSLSVRRREFFTESWLDGRGW